MRPFPSAALLALLLSVPAVAEEQVACTILGCEKVEIEVPDVTAADSFTVQEVWSVVNDILSVSGLAPNFQVVETQEVGNAAAVIIDEQRYLAFNPIWMRTYRDKPESHWQLYAVMAHEVGHHLQGHTIAAGGSRPPTELEADEYAGFVLAALGASLDQAQVLWKSLDAEGSATHPPRHQRLEAVQRGWERRNGTSTPARPMAQAPAVEGETCQRFALAIGPARVCASTTLVNQHHCARYQTYKPRADRFEMGHLFDGDIATAWSAEHRDSGRKTSISFSFERPTTLRVIDIVTGDPSVEGLYGRDNGTARVRTLGIRTSASNPRKLDLKDNGAVQSFELGEIKNVEWVELVMGDTYRSDHCKNAALSEITLR